MIKTATAVLLDHVIAQAKESVALVTLEVSVKVRGSNYLTRRTTRHV